MMLNRCVEVCGSLVRCRAWRALCVACEPLWEPLGVALACPVVEGVGGPSRRF